MGAGRALSAVYLDASAAVKLLGDEAETEALAAFLADLTPRVSSAILQVELVCVCRRQAIGLNSAQELLRGIRMVAVDQAVLDRAGQAFAPPQRALDAVHLATAELVREHVDWFVTYDAAQLDAARAMGLATASPV